MCWHLSQTNRRQGYLPEIEWWAAQVMASCVLLVWQCICNLICYLALCFVEINMNFQWKHIFCLHDYYWSIPFFWRWGCNFCLVSSLLVFFCCQFLNLIPPKSFHSKVEFYCNFTRSHLWIKDHIYEPVKWLYVRNLAYIGCDGGGSIFKRLDYIVSTQGRQERMTQCLTPQH